MFSPEMFHEKFDTPIWERQLRIHSHTLRIGHFVSNLDIHWEKTPFEVQGVLITARTQLKWFQDNCRWVVIDLNRSEAKKHSKPLEPFSLADLRKPITRTSMKKALKSYVGLEREVSTIIQGLRSGQFIASPTMRDSVNEIAEQLFEHGPALIWLTHIKSKDNYTADHCLNVAILAMGLAISLGWKQDEVEEAGLAGLLHDVGKTLVPKKILNKPGKLNDDEFGIMKHHTTLGFEMISRDPSITENVRKAALHHHERPDGLGYPKAMSGVNIPTVASLISIVDAYDAITTNRCYQNARNHHLALGILWKGRNSQFNGPMVEAFISWIGWVSPGTIVKLTTGEIGIVIQANQGNRLQPTVRIIEHTEDENKYLLGPIRELASFSDGNNQEVFIDKVLGNEEIKIDMKDLARQMLVDRNIH